MWKCCFQIFIAYLNFIVPESTLMTFNSKQFMYRTYFVKFKFRGFWELKSQTTFIVSLIHWDKKEVLFLYFQFFLELTY